jgi:hypothetical protein
MTRKLFLIVAVMMLTACQTNVIPSATPIPATATLTSSPLPPTFTPTVTPTPKPPTATPVPSRTPNIAATSRREAILATATTLAGQPIVLDDTFNKTANGWWTGNDSNQLAASNFQITEGVYRWEIDAKQGVFSPMYASVAIPNNFSFSVDVRQVSGPDDSDYGIIFRSPSDTSFYYFAISNSGMYSLLLQQNGEWDTLIAWQRGAGIRPGLVNKLTVTAVDGQFTFFINGIFATQYENDSLTNGRIGLAVDVYHVDEAVFEFDNIIINGIKDTAASGNGQATVVPQTTQPTGTANGQLLLVMCNGLESTITLFFGGQIIKQESLHGKGINTYDLPPGHYDLQFNTVGYYNLNVDFDLGPGDQMTYYLDSDTPC